MGDTPAERIAHRWCGLTAFATTAHGLHSSREYIGTQIRGAIAIAWRKQKGKPLCLSIIIFDKGDNCQINSRRRLGTSTFTLS